MYKSTINHKRITAIVKLEAARAIHMAKEYRYEAKRDPESELTKALKKNVISGIEFDNSNGINREYVTINSEFLAMVGYENNLAGFLADYFGKDYKPTENDPLCFRFLDGFLINPTKIE